MRANELSEIVVADESGNELRFLDYTDYDFEVGEEQNDFEINISRYDWKEIPKGARFYIPGTEYGGIYRSLYTDTENDKIVPGGPTWRGLLQKKIISPQAGSDYATDSGDLNAIIKRRVEAAYPGLMVGVTEKIKNVTTFRYDRYCTLFEGLNKLLAKYNCRLDLSYDDTKRAVIVQAKEIVNYAETIEFSSDYSVDYIMNNDFGGVNHLICLGTGELAARTIWHWYVNAKGKIVSTQYYKGKDEIAEVFDDSSADLADLKKDGKARLEEVKNHMSFEVKIDSSLPVEVGDIVGGRDYLSGMLIEAPVISKIIKCAAGEVSVEYVLSTEKITAKEIEDEGE